MQRSHAFTLIELLLIVAIIGVLGTILISAYQTYTVRREVAEALNIAQAAEKAVVDAWRATSLPPRSRIEAGMPADPAESHGRYVSEIRVVDGRIDIHFGNEAHPDLVGRFLSLTPYVAGAGVTWRCGRAPAPPGEPMTDGTIAAVYQPGTVDPRYLPSACR